MQLYRVQRGISSILWNSRVPLYFILLPHAIPLIFGKLTASLFARFYFYIRGNRFFGKEKGETASFLGSFGMITRLFVSFPLDFLPIN